MILPYKGNVGSIRARFLQPKWPVCKRLYGLVLS